MRDRYISGDELGDPRLTTEGRGSLALLAVIVLMSALLMLVFFALYPILLPIMVLGVIGLAVWCRVTNWRRNRHTTVEIGGARGEPGT